MPLDAILAVLTTNTIILVDLGQLMKIEFLKGKIIAKFMRKSEERLGTLTNVSLQSQMVCMNGENWSSVR